MRCGSVWPQFWSPDSCMLYWNPKITLFLWLYRDHFMSPVWFIWTEQTGFKFPQGLLAVSRTQVSLFPHCFPVVLSLFLVFNHLWKCESVCLSSTGGTDPSSCFVPLKNPAGFLWTLPKNALLLDRTHIQVLGCACLSSHGKWFCANFLTLLVRFSGWIAMFCSDLLKTPLTHFNS